MDETLVKKLQKIKLLVIDFDGVMTDGHVFVNQNGEEMVMCSRKDGLGVEMLKANGIEVKVISKETNPIVAHRCKKLKIACWQNINNSDDKFKIITDIMAEKNILPEEIAYVGDDLNDLNVFGRIGVSVTVADGHDKLKEIADYIISRKGGDHAVREVCEQILLAKNINLGF